MNIFDIFKENPKSIKDAALLRSLLADYKIVDDERVVNAIVKICELGLLDELLKKQPISNNKKQYIITTLNDYLIDSEYVEKALKILEKPRKLSEKVEYYEGFDISDYKGFIVLQDNKTKWIMEITSLDIIESFNKDDIYGVKIPDGIKVIPLATFRDCKNLNFIYIPKSVRVVENLAFENCNAIVSVFIEDIKSWINIKFANNKSNPLFQGRGDLYLNDKKISELVIPSDSSAIKRNAFNGLSVDRIVFPDSLRKIGELSFANNQFVQSIEFGKDSKLKSIDASAFIHCYKIKSVVFPPRPLKIKEQILTNCNNLESITISLNSKSIPLACYFAEISANIDKAKTTIIKIDAVIREPYEYGLKKYFKSVFYKKYEHEFVCYIPKALDTIILQSGKYIPNRAFQNMPVSTIKIPKNTKYIGDYAFAGTSIKSIDLPSTIKVLGLHAFKNCKFLNQILYNGTIKQWSKIKLKNYVNIKYEAYCNYNIHNIKWDKAELKEKMELYNIIVHCKDGDTFLEQVRNK